MGRVLIIEDDVDIRESLTQVLEMDGHVVACASDGCQGLAEARRAHPDVILLDLMMPRLDGFGLIERVRADTELQNIPIIVISAKELSREESMTLQESVKAVMKKQGFEAGRLIEEINTVVGRHS